jgi:hypothetical protein
LPEDVNFDLEKIIKESSKNLKAKYPEGQIYLVQIAKNEMQTHLTLGEIVAIAQNLLKKVGYKGDAP